jgi:hypothetical protein
LAAKVRINRLLYLGKPVSRGFFFHRWKQDPSAFFRLREILAQIPEGITRMVIHLHRGSVRTENTVRKARVKWGKAAPKGAKCGDQEHEKGPFGSESGEIFHLLSGRVLSSDKTNEDDIHIYCPLKFSWIAIFIL